MNYFVKAVKLPLYRYGSEEDVTRYVTLKPKQRISQVVSASPPSAVDETIELWVVIEEDDLPTAPVVEIRAAKSPE